MKMNEIEVSLLSDGDICVSQFDEANVIQFVRITKEQANLVCEWILGAAKSNVQP